MGSQSHGAATNHSYSVFTIYLTNAIEYVEDSLQVPFYHLILELFMIIWIIKLLTHKSYKPREQRLQLTPEEEDQLIEEWMPEPLVPVEEVPDYVKNPSIVHGKPGTKMTVNGRECLNLATYNFLGLVGNRNIEESAVKSLKKYGVGTCGPRGFYGTIDIHLELEKRIADFLQTEEAILYSYGFSTIASAIPAYSKRTDVIFCDDGVSLAVRQGIIASRSRVYWFNHNDMEDLENKLLDQAEKDKKNPKKAKVTRRFLVVEGLYVNYGDLAPLPRLVELKRQYKVRLFVEESCSFGVLGKHGRGITEHYNMPFEVVDLIAVSLETSLASIGGFCAGTSFVVDHQRLSGQGYCFSASLPPLLASAAHAAIDIIENEPERMERLRRNAALMRQHLRGLKAVEVGGVDVSPVIHLRLSTSLGDLSRKDQEVILQKIVDCAYEEHVALTIARYLTELEMNLPPASIRMTVNCEMSEADIENAASVIKKAVVEATGS